MLRKPRTNQETLAREELHHKPHHRTCRWRRRLQFDRVLGVRLFLIGVLLQITVLVLQDLQNERRSLAEGVPEDLLEIAIGVNSSSIKPSRSNDSAEEDDDDALQMLPIDNYYSRRHITPTARQPSPMLIVGGSDGSGTRAVVEVLQQLRVPMIVDDPITLDAHASQIYDGQGWPALVKEVLQESRSANYTLQSLSLSTRSNVLAELRKIAGHHGYRFKHVLAQMVQQHGPTSQNVQYGFKAPSTMLLLALLRIVYGKVKYLHVVRDGRDVALSSNQSPVDKFYDVFYTDAAERRNQSTEPSLLAMQLWNDWNLQALDFMSRHSDGTTFDYLVVRIEDLMNPHTKYHTLLQLRDFVGSPRSLPQLCCLSLELIDAEEAVRRGSDTVAESSTILSRYGRWRQQLADQPERTARLQGNGQEALKAFGYEPRRKYRDSPHAHTRRPTDVCDASIDCQQVRMQEVAANRLQTANVEAIQLH